MKVGQIWVREWKLDPYYIEILSVDEENKTATFWYSNLYNSYAMRPDRTIWTRDSGHITKQFRPYTKLERILA